MNHKVIGRKFDDVHRQEEVLEEVQAVACKRNLVLEIQDLMKKRRINKSTLAKRMKTSRSSLNRLLDPKSNQGATLITLHRVALALNARVSVSIAEEPASAGEPEPLSGLESSLDLTF